MSNNERTKALERRLVGFAVRVVRLADRLPYTYSGQHFSQQVVRSGSAPALIYGEARSAESMKDFKHKSSLILKELRETYMNLQIVKGIGYFEEDRLRPLIAENNELISIFVTTVRTTKKRLEQVPKGRTAVH